MLVIFGMLPLIRLAVRTYRHQHEVAPIKKGLIEMYKRKYGVLLADTGKILVYGNRKPATVSYSLNPDTDLKVHQGNYLLRLETAATNHYFSRDTTVGQVVCVLYDEQQLYGWPDRQRIIGIYFEPGTAKLNPVNYNIRVAAIPLREGKTAAYFIAETFSNDLKTEKSVLAGKRMEAIAAQLKKSGVDHQQFSLTAF